MAKEMKVTILLPAGLTLTEAEQQSLGDSINVQLAGIYAAKFVNDPAPLIDSNFGLGKLGQESRAKKPGAKKAAGKSSKKKR